MAVQRFRFGLFELDTGTRELRRDGAVLRLQAQPAQVLAVLVQRADEVVSREELCAAVWGKETFVDFERGLNFCIGQIRSALGDDASTPRYIRTISKRGYQFIAPVTPIPEQALGDKEGSARPGKRMRMIAYAAGMFALLVALGLVWRLRGQHGVLPGTNAPILAVLRFDNETIDPGNAVFADALTDNVVEQLTSLSQRRYLVIGNAAILRKPREERDLTAIYSSLHARYVVLGQVQENASQRRILAHLIRLPEQTHVWVVRVDGTPGEVQDEASIARKIASEFSEHLSKNSAGRASSESAKN